MTEQHVPDDHNVDVARSQAPMNLSLSSKRSMPFPAPMVSSTMGQLRIYHSGWSGRPRKPCSTHLADTTHATARALAATNQARPGESLAFDAGAACRRSFCRD